MNPALPRYLKPTSEPADTAAYIACSARSRDGRPTKTADQFFSIERAPRTSEWAWKRTPSRPRRFLRRQEARLIEYWKLPPHERSGAMKTPTFLSTDQTRARATTPRF